MKQTLLFSHLATGDQDGSNKLHANVYGFVTKLLEAKGYEIEQSNENPLVTLHTNVSGKSMSFKVCVKTEDGTPICFANASYTTPGKKKPQDWLLSKHQSNFKKSLPQILSAITEAVKSSDRVMAGLSSGWNKKTGPGFPAFFLLQKDADFVGGK